MYEVLRLDYFVFGGRFLKVVLSEELSNARVQVTTVYNNNKIIV